MVNEDNNDDAEVDEHDDENHQYTADREFHNKAPSIIGSWFDLGHIEHGVLKVFLSSTKNNPP